MNLKPEHCDHISIHSLFFLPQCFEFFKLQKELNCLND